MSVRYPHLFRPYNMAGVELRNRVVFAGHGSRFVDWQRHHLDERQADYLAERARGGVGLVIQGSAMVHPTGLAAAGVNEVWSDEAVPAYRRVTEAVHAEGAAIFGQLSHLGRQGNTFAAQRELWAPSAIPDPASRVVPHAMTRADIRELIDAYRAGATRMLEAGFDGIEVYLAHGYLLCSFLSPFSNDRTDAYGGSFEARLRLPLEVIAAVREVVGADVPIGIRVSADEFVPGGLDIVLTRDIITSILAEQPLQYVSVSQSNYVSLDRQIPDMSFPRVPFAHYAGEVREVTDGVPVFAVARLVEPAACERLLADGTADFVCLVRPLIADPQWVAKAREDRPEDIRPCISCNVGCRGGPHRGLPVACLVNPAVGREREWGVGTLRKVERPHRVVVIGGGPGGLEAATTAAARGNQVILLEATDRLGGQVLVAAAAMPYRDEFADSVRYLEREASRLGVDVRTGTRADVALVQALEPDAVIVATGALPGRPPVPGGELAHVSTVQDAILRGIEGRRVVLIDSGEADWRCLTTAERLAADGHQVRLVSPVPVGAEIDAFSRPPLIRRLRAADVAFHEYSTVVAIEPDAVVVRDSWTGDTHRWEDVDAVVVAWFGVADDALHHLLSAIDGLEVHAVGDCLAPRRAIDAIWDGHRIGRLVGSSSRPGRIFTRSDAGPSDTETQAVRSDR